MVNETPVVTHIVRGVQKVDETSFRVALATGDTGLHLHATDAADAEGWYKALAKAAVWDQHSSSQEVGTDRAATCFELLSLKPFRKA